ncbi:4Fe-4S binding protein [Vampirovibrio chlorellavorus]|uniref:4Fe-4S binding protein n=1 Tax=Vampirovibrio chlorellavorus TaxID=758823 RepID=UPI0026EB9406|nr:4Fe-4S binding protein [Vampirovibrio chlorellavorus]
MKQSSNPLKYRYHAFRGKLIQPFFWALCFLSPVLDVFRVDMIHQHLMFLGKPWPFAFENLKWLPIGFYGAVILIGVISFIWGRLFCGWACPHNTLTEWTHPLRAMVGLAPKPRWMKLILRDHPSFRFIFPALSPVLAILLTFGLSLLLCFYVVPPQWVIQQYASGHPHIALVFGNGLFLLIGLFLLFVGNDFCRTCCPYGLAQSISAYHEDSPWRPLEIQFQSSKTEDCKSCTACQIVCPVDIDPRDTGALKVGQFDGCFNCGECIDACKFIHSFKSQPGLLSFQNPGFKAAKAKTTRPAP